MKKVFVCRDTITGIFSGIYEAWKLALQEQSTGIGIKGMVEQELFCDYIEAKESEQKAIAVEKLIWTHLGDEAYWNLYHALLSHDEKKGDAVFRMMLEARKIPNSRKIMNHLANPDVQKVFQLSRTVSNEAHYHKEFIRFRELENGVLFSKINPKTKILTCIADHFSNRLPLENWIVYDETHKEVLVHEAKKQCVIVIDENVNLEKTQHFSQTEQQFELLWKDFCESISIKERENKKLQRQHLPLWYRENMVEFTK